MSISGSEQTLAGRCTKVSSGPKVQKSIYRPPASLILPASLSRNSVGVPVAGERGDGAAGDAQVYHWEMIPQVCVWPRSLLDAAARLQMPLCKSPASFPDWPEPIRAQACGMKVQGICLAPAIGQTRWMVRSGQGRRTPPRGPRKGSAGRSPCGLTPECPQPPVRT